MMVKWAFYSKYDITSQEENVDTCIIKNMH